MTVSLVLDPSGSRSDSFSIAFNASIVFSFSFQPLTTLKNGSLREFKLMCGCVSFALMATKTFKKVYVRK